MIGDEAELLLANETFYEAFSAGDVAAMDALWAREAPVACVHPGADVLTGRTMVMRAWTAILNGGGAPGIGAERPIAAALGDAGYVTCIERLGEGRLIATNVFVREGGRWHMVHHHAGPLAVPPARHGDAGS